MNYFDIKINQITYIMKTIISILMFAIVSTAHAQNTTDPYETYTAEKRFEVMSINVQRDRASYTGVNEKQAQLWNTMRFHDNGIISDISHGWGYTVSYETNNKSYKVTWGSEVNHRTLEVTFTMNFEVEFLCNSKGTVLHFSDKGIDGIVDSGWSDIHKAEYFYSSDTEKLHQKESNAYWQTHLRMALEDAYQHFGIQEHSHAKN